MSGIKIRTGDLVQVLTGKDRGKQGTVSRVLPKKNKVIVDGVNVAKKHQKAQSAEQTGGIIDKILPVQVGNVAIVCGKCGGPSKIGFSFVDGKKIRVCRKCGESL